MRKKELKNGSVVTFKPITEKYGRAEFFICPIWKRGKIKELFIYPVQQPDAKNYFVIKSGFSDSLCINSEAYKEEPRIWITGWCKEHKTTFLRFYVPKDCDFFTVRSLSSLDIRFGKKKEVKP